MPSKKATECHPERRHHARGLCKACYKKAGPFSPIVRTLATCHPNRKHKAKGLCRFCYHLSRYPKKPKLKIVPDCHPDRPHLAKGKCSECYYKTRYQEPEVRARAIAYQAEYRKLA